MPKFDRKAQYILMGILIFIIGLFYFSTLRNGHNWGGDFSMYIHHAKNISEGKPYSDTGYIYNPSHPFLGPKSYPPVFPVLLVPVYLVSGLNFQAMKVIPILFFLLSLVVINLNFKDKISFFSTCYIIGAIGFNYFFWDFKDSILSDIPFLFFNYTFLYLVEKLYCVERSSKKNINLLLLSGIFLYLSYGTRTIGIVLFPCLLFYEYVNQRKLTYKSLSILVVFLILLLVQNLLINREGSYLDQLYFNPQVILENIKYYQWHATNFWSNGFFYPLSEWLFIIISAISVCGFLFRSKKMEIYEFFFLFYLIVIFVWPTNQGTRFLIPIMPLYLFYFFYFFKVVDRMNLRNQYVGRAFVSLLCVVIGTVGFSYGMLYFKHGLPVIHEGIHRIESVKMFDIVRNNTTEEDVIIFVKPRVLSLMTARNSSSYHQAKEDEELFDYFDQIGASFLIVPIKGFSYLKDPYLMRFVLRNKQRFVPIYSGYGFSCFRIS